MIDATSCNTNTADAIALLAADLTPEERLIERQLDLEEESLALGQKRYFDRLAKQQDRGEEAGTRPALALLRRTVETLAEGIELTLAGDRDRRGQAGRMKAAVPLLEGLGAEELAYLTLRGAMGSISQDTAYARVAERIGTSVMEELHFRRFKAQDEKTYRQTQKHIESANTGEKRRKIMRHMFRVAQIEGLNWSDEQRMHVGGYLIDVLLKVCGDLFETHLRLVSRNNRIRVLSASEALAAFLSEGHEVTAALCPVRLPMLVKPRDWTGPLDGGYLTDCGGRLDFLKTRNKGYLRTLEYVDLSDLLEAVNVLQSVRWSINTNVLEVAKRCWAEGIAVGDLPNVTPEELPAQPAQWQGRMNECRKEDYETYISWAKKAAVVHERNNRILSRRSAAREQLAIAEKFANEAAIYFPHQLDFRGRAYAVPVHLNPQGTDLSKSLLRFAEGKPITERGYWWLQVHVANCFGVDKVSFEERVAWTNSNLEALLDSAIDPLGGSRFWMKADDPWQALAACFELLGYAVNGPDHVCRIAIPMDGSCNGLQNFSALLRDPVGGKATNLMPSNKPSDIYAEVARVVAAQVKADAEGGNVMAILWDGHISRKIVKQPVMTLPYGATKAGMRSQLEQAARKNLPGVIPQNTSWAACGYLAEVVYESIGKVVIAARAAMDWLQAVAKLAASVDCPVRWTSPIGLPVLQEYREKVGKQIRLHIEGKQQKLNLSFDGDKLDKRRQALGISPNLIHSFDASHMMRTMLVGKDNGIHDWAMIHDSFGTHACDTDLLHQCIREAFIEQYQPNLLERFRAELAEQMSPEAAAKLPPVPTTGTLDLDAIRSSRYFFA
jgi:DNA-directed RNA polymerase